MKFFSKVHPVKIDDSDMIFLDWNAYTPEEIDNMILSHFDVINVPFGIDYKFKNYFQPTYFKSNKSSTGWIAMFLNNNKTIYRQGVKSVTELNNMIKLENQ